MKMERCMFQKSLNAAATHNIVFEDITYVTKCNKGLKTIIKGVSGKLHSGELTAIMGPSGAGKTSLLNILTGFQTQNIRGTIKWNGIVQKAGEPLSYKKSSCYILQDNLLPAYFTVRELMMISANLKIANISKKSKNYLIDEILSILHLEKCQHTRSQHLSGGQQKRLSIALELVDNPPIMFLDEPTTGLDSLSTLQCIHMLKELAKGGRTIICTIHQPSATIYNMFDHIYMMTQGRCVYQGSSLNTVAYLSSLGFHCPQYHNPCDYFLEVVCGDHGDVTEFLCKAAEDGKWRNSNTPIINCQDELEIITKIDDHSSTFEIPSEWSKFCVIMKRTSVCLYRDWTLLQLKLFMHLFVGMFLGLNFQKAGNDASKVIVNLGFMLCSVVYLSYTAIMPAVLKFPSEVAILKKERFNNWYKLRTYYLATLLFDLPIQISLAVFYSVGAYTISSQPFETFRILMFLLIMILVGTTSTGIGLFFGSLLNPINGTFFGAITLAVMLSLGGFLIVFTHMSSFTYALTYLSFLAFAIEGINESLYGFNRSELPCPVEEVYCQFNSPQSILKFFGMDKENYWIDVGYLLFMTILMRTVAYFALKKKMQII